MKKGILTATILFVALFSKSSFGQQIAVVQNGVPVFTVDSMALIATYNTNLYKASGIQGNFTKAQIIAGEESYVLVFSGGAYVSKLQMNTLGNNSAGNMVLVAVGATSCTTTDCSEESTGCVPKTWLNGCTPCSNKGKCTRTTSNVSLLLPTN